MSAKPYEQRWHVNAVCMRDPLHWRKPRAGVRIVGDLFDESRPDESIDRAVAVMARARRHTFQVLTTRPDRMRDYFDGITAIGGAKRLAGVIAWGLAGAQDQHALDVVDSLLHRGGDVLPLPNVWLGVSVEDQATADARVPLLLSTPAAVRFVSAEPLLGPIDFGEVVLVGRWMGCPEETDDEDTDPCNGCDGNPRDRGGDRCFAERGPALDWVIVGGPYGPGALPCDVEWVRSIVRQCRAAGTACFVQQLGARPYQYDWVGLDWPNACAGAPHPDAGGSAVFATLHDRKGGDPSEWPADIRVRQMPGGAS